MSLFDRLVSSTRGLIMIDDKVDRLERAVEKLADKVDEHDRRIVRIETIIEFARPSGRNDPRLPG